MSACERCHGLLVATDLAYDGIGAPAAFRCLQCGDLVDAIIVRHRTARPEPYSDATLPKYKQPATTKQAPI